MKLGLLGSQIQHSLSPALYREFLGESLESYALFDCSSVAEIPKLTDLAQRLDGLSITAPYKTHFLPDVSFQDSVIEKLGGINCISFSDRFWATNTDYLALKTLLPETLKKYPDHDIFLLGDGVMARITVTILNDLRIDFHSLSRKIHGPLENIDLQDKSSKPLLIINACSRKFIFQGRVPADSVFWDYNYSFRSHSETLPDLFKTYIDGQELLRRQALAAITFWRETNPKLKC